jgi:hypothetical protein
VPDLRLTGNDITQRIDTAVVDRRDNPIDCERVRL